MKFEIIKHINKKFLGLICEVKLTEEEFARSIVQGKKYFDVMFDGGELHIKEENLHAVEEDRKISKFPELYVRKKNKHIHIKGLGEAKPLKDDFIDPLKGVKADPNGRNVEDKPIKKKIPSFF